MRVEVHAVSYRHRLAARWAVAGATFRAEPGECVGIVGPNGAGKSTLLACVLGFLRPAVGRVRLDGRVPDDLRVRAGLGILTERPVFPRGMTAEQVLAFHHALLGRPGRCRATETRALLGRVGLEQVARKAAQAFSHGMRQRLGLACALLGDPRLLVLDEPATGLDPPGIALLREEIRRARDRGATVLLSSHQLDEVERTCRRVLALDAGRVRADVEVRALGRAPRVLRLRAVTPGGDPVEATALGAAAAGLGAIVSSPEAGLLRLRVTDDRAAAAAVAGLLARGVQVVEAAPEQSRLEALFAGTSAP